MRVVLDTNVFISGLFFSGPPFQILEGWKNGKFEIVVSAESLEEYRRVGVELSEKYTPVDLTPFLELLISHASVVHAPHLDEGVCSDPDDDKFVACALAGRSKFICSGDKALMKISGYKGIAVVTPRVFVDRFLPHKK